MQTHFGKAALALVLASMAGTASAQTVITTEPPAIVTERPAVVVTEPPAVVTTQAPLSLSPAQRTTIYRTIVPRKSGKPIIKEKVVTETVARAPTVTTQRVVRPPAVQYVVGDRVPAEVELAPVPPTVVTEVPAVRDYKYMVVNNRLLLIDPATSTVVTEIRD